MEQVGDSIEADLLEDARRCPAAMTPVGVNVYERFAVNDLPRDSRADCRMTTLAWAQGIFEGP